MSSATQSAVKAQLRPVGRRDAELLFTWLNRPDSLAASLETVAPVEWDVHKQWFDARLSDPDTRLWVVEYGGTPVGSIRLQDKGDGPEIAIYLEESARGAGVAGNALRLALDEGRAVWPGREAIARVRPDNVASQRFFERARFSLKSRSDDHLVYVYFL